VKCCVLSAPYPDFLFGGCQLEGGPDVDSISVIEDKKAGKRGSTVEKMDHKGGDNCFGEETASRFAAVARCATVIVICSCGQLWPGLQL